jgi:hypothetical protein
MTTGEHKEKGTLTEGNVDRACLEWAWNLPRNHPVSLWCNITGWFQWKKQQYLRPEQF